MSAADFAVQEPAPWATYRRMLEEGAFPYQQCTACSRAVFYPRVLCPHCGSVDLEWRTSTGEGTVYSQTFMAERDGDGRQILLVDMAEGYRIMGTAPGRQLQIGDLVHGRIVTNPERPDDEPQYVFDGKAL